MLKEAFFLQKCLILCCLLCKLHKNAFFTENIRKILKNNMPAVWGQCKPISFKRQSVLSSFIFYGIPSYCFKYHFQSKLDQNFSSWYAKLKLKLQFRLETRVNYLGVRGKEYSIINILNNLYQKIIHIKSINYINSYLEKKNERKRDRDRERGEKRNR